MKRQSFVGATLLLTAFALFNLIRSPDAFGASQPDNSTIVGTLIFEEEGTFHIYLVDESTFKVPMKGVRKITVRPTGQEQKASTAKFRFNNIPKGIYGIRCFLDQNDNGRLDRSLFGPSEPWGMSFKNKRSIGRPHFEQISFELKGGTRSVRISVE